MQQLLQQTGSTTDDLFQYTSGPRNARVLVVGEAWGWEEEVDKLPFVGASGKEFTRILSEAGLTRGDLLLTNVVHDRPPGNDFEHYLCKKGDLDAYDHIRGLKAKAKLSHGVRTLERLIRCVKPELIIAAGNVPLWVLSDHSTVAKSGTKLPSGITSWRGSETFTRDGLGKIPLLPIIHPAAILREWGFRAITINDLGRAARFLRGNTSWNPPARTFRLVKPTWPEISGYLWQLRQRLGRQTLEIAVDLETYKRKWVSTIGIADERSEICIPLLRPIGEENVDSYLEIHQEIELWQELKHVLEHPNVRIIGQNFIYDTEWFYRYYNIRALVSFDTMVAHHLLFPGTPKRLDYLASLYCDHYCYWKDESGDWDKLPRDPIQYWTYNCKDTRATYDIAQVLKKALADEKMTHLYQDRLDQWHESRRMSLTGIPFNLPLQKEMRLQFVEEASQISQWLLNAVPEALQYTSTGKPWFASPKATMNLLYSVLGLTPILHKKTKKPTSDDQALAQIDDEAELPWLAPLLERLRHLRSIGVFISHFLDARPGVDGKMRCSFNVAHPETFRWSSNANGFAEGTNLQNIPKGEEDLIEAEEDPNALLGHNNPPEGIDD